MGTNVLRMTTSPNGDPFTAALARELRVAQMDAGLTRKELSARSGIPTRTLVRYLDGEREIGVSAFRALCTAIGVSMAAITDAAERALGK